jgi:uncharacterized protein (DUF169 family)
VEEDSATVDLSIYRGFGEELEQRLRPKTYPIAVKLHERASDIPSSATRPLKDLGHHLSLCQAFQLSRREGTVMAMLKEDMWCFEPVVGFGLAEPPERFMQGHNRYPKDVASLEAGSHYADEFPRLEVGKYVGVASAPLRATDFEPDLVVIYGDSAQLNLLLLAREYEHGHGLKCALSGHAACVYGVVPVVQTGKCHVAVPCRGDRYHAMAGDDELLFSVPRQGLDSLMSGLRYVNSTGSRLPRGYSFQPEYPLPESYEQIARLMDGP